MSGGRTALIRADRVVLVHAGLQAHVDPVDRRAEAVEVLGEAERPVDRAAVELLVADLEDPHDPHLPRQEHLVGPSLLMMSGE